MAGHGHILTMRQAAHELLGKPDTRASARWLLRYLEDNAPKALLRPDIPWSSTTPWRTSKDLLRRHAPELFPRRDQAMLMLTELHDTLDDVRKASEAMNRRILRIEQHLATGTK